MNPTKHCPRCDTDHPRSAFYACSSHADGLSGYCRWCATEVARERRARQERFKVRCPACHRYFLPKEEAVCCSPACSQAWERHMSDVRTEHRRYEDLALPEACVCGRPLEGETDWYGGTLEKCEHCGVVTRPRCRA